jgi:hypothetical protein
MVRQVDAPVLGLRFQKEAISYLGLKTGDVLVDVLYSFCILFFDFGHFVYSGGF